MARKGPFFYSNAAPCGPYPAAYLLSWSGMLGAAARRSRRFSSMIVTMRQSAIVISNPAISMVNETTPNPKGFATPRNAPYIQHAMLTADARSIGVR